ncbi:filamin/ABP280 repeat containing protein [Entamoeba histolytica KU27]|uniref:Filamin/ABP280 repeat containing protein n=1 Tax=Entamoeba histolytica KU27 TaxID=885311 RepID=M2S7D0_ENTHI|nr:filamin/ABP280 repeat containing protein [Entamoeba histolytica KU27]
MVIKLVKHHMKFVLERELIIKKSGVDCFQFTILAKSKRGGPVKPGNAKFSVKIIHENGTEIPQENIDIKNLKEAKYRVTYKVSEHGDYTIHCLLNNRDIKGSPWVQQC